MAKLELKPLPTGTKTATVECKDHDPIEITFRLPDPFLTWDSRFGSITTAEDGTASSSGTRGMAAYIAAHLTAWSLDAEPTVESLACLLAQDEAAFFGIFNEIQSMDAEGKDSPPDTASA